MSTGKVLDWLVPLISKNKDLAWPSNMTAKEIILNWIFANNICTIILSRGAEHSYLPTIIKQKSSPSINWIGPTDVAVNDFISGRRMLNPVFLKLVVGIYQKWNPTSSEVATLSKTVIRVQGKYECNNGVRLGLKYRLHSTGWKPWLSDNFLWFCGILLSQIKWLWTSDEG